MMRKLLFVTMGLIISLCTSYIYPASTQSTSKKIDLKKEKYDKATRSSTYIIKAYLNDNSLTVYFLTPLENPARVDPVRQVKLTP